jgi:hypothetical protein
VPAYDPRPRLAGPVAAPADPASEEVVLTRVYGPEGAARRPPAAGRRTPRACVFCGWPASRGELLNGSTAVCHRESAGSLRCPTQKIQYSIKITFKNCENILIFYMYKL